VRQNARGELVSERASVNHRAGAAHPSRTGCSIRAKSLDRDNATPHSRGGLVRVDDKSASATHDRDTRPSFSKSERPQPIARSGVVESAEIGGERGIRTQDGPLESASYRFHNAMVAVDASVAVAPCTRLHAS
jgi:hypothetical protein